MPAVVPRSVLITRWSARILSGMILAFWGYFLGAHLVEAVTTPPSKPLRPEDIVILSTLITSLLGLAVGWKWELLGGLVTLIAIAVCAYMNLGVLLFPGTLIPITALLYLVTWWLASRNQVAITSSFS